METQTITEISIRACLTMSLNYSDKVKAAIHDRLYARWPPMNNAEQVQLERNWMFFVQQCDFDEADADGRTIEEVADDEIDAAHDSQ